LKYSKDSEEEQRNPGDVAADFFVYLCINKTDLADQVFTTGIEIKDDILKVVIFFPIALLFVIFLTYG
jgi:hypothetical protein